MINWQAWRNSQLRQREKISWATAAGLVLLVLVGIWIAGLSGLLKLSDTQGDAIAVKLGSPDGENLPLKVMPMPDPAFVPESQTSSSSAPLAVSSSKSPATVPEHSPSTPVAPRHPVAKPVPSVNQRVVRGEENGNAMETVFKDGAGHVGRSLYVPIYLYMPLPSKIRTGLVNHIPDSSDGFQSAQARRENLARWYRPEGDFWHLKTQPPYDERPALWIALQDGGYDTAQASYKTTQALSPITLEFTLSPPKEGRPPELLEVKLVHSSGDSAVDTAVIYGFRMSAFANGTGQDAHGVFTYDFSGK